MIYGKIKGGIKMTNYFCNFCKNEVELHDTVHLCMRRKGIKEYYCCDSCFEKLNKYIGLLKISK